MNDQQYLSHCRELFSEFARGLLSRTEHLPAGDSLRQLAEAFGELADSGGDLYGDGATLTSRLFITYPDFAPTYPRELLWFLGGECLHFMPDEEIQLFQQLEEQRIAAAAKGETLDLREARAKLLKLQ